MSLLNDFENAKFSTKTIVLYYLLTMPSFFICIYLFKPEMIHLINGNPLVNLHFYFLASVSLVLSTLWLSLVYWVTAVRMKYYEKIDRHKNQLLKRNKAMETLEKIKTGDQETKINEISKMMTMVIEEKLNKKRISNRFTTNSENHYRFTLIYSMVYLSGAMALNHYLLHLSISAFLFALGLFTAFMIPIIKRSLKKNYQN